METFVFDNAPRLKAQLFTTCTQAGIKSASIAVYRSDRAVIASYPDSFEATRVGIGCIWKGLTATLVGGLVAERKLDLESDVRSLFDSLGKRDLNIPAGIKVRHLLTHAHGLDDSNLHTAPLLAGRIDVAALAAVLSGHERIFEPGAAFHYGNAGSWLAAALVEAILDRSFTELVVERILAAARTDEFEFTRASTPSYICPALGGEHAFLSAKQLLAIIARSYLLAGPRNVSFLSAHTSALPGTTGGKDGAICGWYDYGSGWYGQNGIYDGQSAIVRFNTQRQIAVIVTSESEQAFRVLAVCFAHSLPEFEKRREFRAHAPDASLDAAAIAHYVGTYSNAGTEIVVEPGERTALRVEIRTLEERADSVIPTLSYDLRPTKGNVFFCVPGDRNITHLEFIGRTAPIGFDYLWNGRQLWRRIAAAK